MLSANELEQMFKGSIDELTREADGDWELDEISGGYASEEDEYLGADIYEWGNRPSALVGQRLEDCIRSLLGVFKGEKERILRSKLLPAPFESGAEVQFRTTCGWADGKVQAIINGPPMKVDIRLDNGVVIPNVDILNIRKKLATHQEKVAFQKILLRQIDKLRLSLDTLPSAVRSLVLSIDNTVEKKVRFSESPNTIIGVLYYNPSENPSRALETAPNARKRKGTTEYPDPATPSPGGKRRRIAEQDSNG
eukprot:TRINITY_DN31595_c0_g1_i1.p1 TRINITY_DN31595_c0_g1~~TRINITY_DN31595_c0_g1_i1.p1  ORF type:complete len:251 (+),score=11.68 TRINITY_DN31595_c0_g1_i1:128-880(+)